MRMDQLQSAFANGTEAGAPASVEMKNTLGGVVSALTQLPQWAGVLREDELEQRIVFRRHGEGGRGNRLPVPPSPFLASDFSPDSQRSAS
jgi:hypothetical protein